MTEERRFDEEVMSVLAGYHLQSGDYETAASTYYILSAFKPGIIALTTDAFNMAGEMDSALVYYNKIVPMNPNILCKESLNYVKQQLFMEER